MNEGAKMKQRFKCPLCKRQLPKGYENLLTYLAQNKEIEQYTTPEAIHRDYRQTLRLLREFQRAGLVRLVRTETASKHGKDKNIWSLTLEGQRFYKEARIA